MSPTPEQKARQDIDAALEAAGWIVQDRAAMNLAAGPGVAVREFKMAPAHGFADYLLFVNGKAVGVLEAKPAGYALTNVELQADKYATGLPAGLNPPVHPLPFLYLSTGVESRFINGLDPDPNTRTISANLPHIHRRATLAEWISAETLDGWVKRLHAYGGERSLAAYIYDEILARDKVSLDLFWLRDESLEDSASLPEPHLLAQEIGDDLRSALAQIEDVLGDLEQRVDAGASEEA
jgi:type I restriction enzyme R subunit